MTKAAKSKVRVTVILDMEDHDRLEGYCESQGHKKSTLIARIIREYLATHGPKAAKVGPRRLKGMPKTAPARARSSKARRKGG